MANLQDSLPALKVAKALLERQAELTDDTDRKRLYQAEISEQTGLQQASLSNLLKTMEKENWLVSEEVASERGGRPFRYYELTREGAVMGREALRSVRIDDPLDNTDVNVEFSSFAALSAQGPAHDHTYNVLGRFDDRRALCDAVWEAVEHLRGGYEVWTRNETSVRVRTDNDGIITLFLKEIKKVENEFYPKSKVAVPEG